MIFPIRFLVCNLFIIILLGLLLLTQNLLKRHLTFRGRYGLWYVFAGALLIPFLPYQIFAPEKFFLLLSQIFYPASMDRGLAAAGSAVNPIPSADAWLQDFSAAVASTSSPWFLQVLWGIWIIGGCAAAILFVYNIIRILYIRRNSYPVTEQAEPGFYQQFSGCQEELHIHRRIALYASCQISSPFSYGLLRPRIIIPQDLDILLSEEEIRYIFLHELQHCKHKDAFLNGLSCILQIIYWFNPFIWYGFRQMQKDRELACDNAVIDIIGKEHCAKYGFTLIRYAETLKRGSFLSPLSSMGGAKKIMQQRIMAIACYQKDSVRQKIRSAALVLLAAVTVACASPLFAANSFSDSVFRLDGDNWSALDASSHFDGRRGTFVLYDMDAGQYRIYNKEQSEQRISPDSTFKIYSGLIALEEGLISPSSSIQKWDGTSQMYDAWSHDQTMASAMKNSVNWYFQNLDRQIGLSTLYSYYRKFSYGNCDLTGGIENYWAESSLKVSPIEQVNALSALLNNEWGFEPQNIQAIRDSLFLFELPSGKLYGKTGTGAIDGQNCSGWFVGFIETDNHTYCFAANLQDSGRADGSAAAQVTIDILNDLL